MIKPTIHSGPEVLAEFAKECEEALLTEVQCEFVYPSGCGLQCWPIDDIKNQNQDFLKNLNGRANVYAIFVRQNPSNAWNLVYVGQRKSANLRERLTQHLIRKSAQTGSMLEDVKSAVAEGKEIGVSCIKVEPESLRLFVEETIIRSLERKPPWNKHGTGPL